MATFPKHRGVLIDVSCVVFVGLIVAFFELFAWPAHRGFFCDDESIRYPMVSQTVSTLLLVAVCFLTPIVVFFAVEGTYMFEGSTPRDSWHSVTAILLKRLMEVYGVFLFGAGLNQLTVDTGKYSIGRLRPHFLDACKPDELVCSSNSATPHFYITEYQCMGDEHVIEEARLSFPSGHAALAFYTAVYISIFLQQRLTGRSVRLSRHLAQALVLLVAWFTALSRVHDYMHHATDVLAGILIGTVWAVLVTSFVIDLKLDPSQTTKDELRSLRSTPNHIEGANSV